MPTETLTPRTYTIRHRWTGAVIFSLEIGSLRLCLEAAVSAGADLRDADLRDADLRDTDLRDTDLRDANLIGADLRDAHLRGADLIGANLTGADLRGADLIGANLTGANLRAADLTGANLTGADLRDAHLRDADLRDANLIGANLTGANLRAADLTGADLRDADLIGADLRDAHLRDANLRPIRDDLWAVLSGAPAEVPGLRQALLEGQIDGSTYTGPCACLVGTLAKVHGCRVDELPLIQPNASRLSERWFTNLRPGDTPENSEVARITLEWVECWLSNMRAAFGAPTPVTVEEEPCPPLH